MTENKLKLIDQVRQVIRIKHYSLRTGETYINWIKRFIFFHNKKHPVEMGEEEDVETTTIYTHVIKQGRKGVRSPSDFLFSLPI